MFFLKRYDADTAAWEEIPGESAAEMYYRAVQRCRSLHETSGQRVGIFGQYHMPLWDSSVDMPHSDAERHVQEGQP